MEQDIFYAQSRTGYAELIKKRVGAKQFFGTAEVSEIFNKCSEVIRCWIEEGRLPAVDTNAGRTRDGQSVRANYTITRKAIIELAERIEKGQ